MSDNNDRVLPTEAEFEKEAQRQGDEGGLDSAKLFLSAVEKDDRNRAGIINAYWREFDETGDLLSAACGGWEYGVREFVSDARSAAPFESDEEEISWDLDGNVQGSDEFGDETYAKYPRDAGMDFSDLWTADVDGEDSVIDGEEFEVDGKTRWLPYLPQGEALDPADERDQQDEEWKSYFYVVVEDEDVIDDDDDEEEEGEEDSEDERFTYVQVRRYCPPYQTNTGQIKFRNEVTYWRSDDGRPLGVGVEVDELLGEVGRLDNGLFEQRRNDDWLSILEIDG